MSNSLDMLNSAQRQAVTHKSGPLLIVAGAGTGKTTVITQRIAWLIEQENAKSDEILALTFTDKAAGEMEERVDLLLPYGYVDLWISTFHAFAERILHSHAIDIGLAGEFRLLDTTSAWMLVREHLEEFDLDYYRPIGNPTKFIHALLMHFSRLKDENITPTEYLAYAETLQGATDNTADMERRPQGQGKKKAGGKTKKQDTSSRTPQDDAVQQVDAASDLPDDPARVLEVAKAYHTYQRLLQEQGAMDFGDLITSCLALFRQRPHILEKYRRQFRYILVDEFQDTNMAQYELVKLLAAPQNNLTVVADDDQSIYRFRGASMSNIVQFEGDYPLAASVFLTENYRSKQNILDLAYRFIQQNNPNRLEYRMQQQDAPTKKTSSKKKKSAVVEEAIDQAAAKLGKISKKLVAADQGQGVIEHLHGLALDDEVALVVDKIREITAAATDITWNDFAILVRANASVSPFLVGLEQAGIPYQFIASKGLYREPLVMDILSYLRVLEDQHDSPALYRVLSIPVLGIMTRDILTLNAFAQRKAMPLLEALRQSAGVPGISADGHLPLQRVYQLIMKHAEEARVQPVSTVVLGFLEDSGYLKSLTTTDSLEMREKLHTLQLLHKRLQRFEEESDDRRCTMFLRHVALERESGEEGSLGAAVDAGPQAVKVMTIHASKGLEFEHVFIVNMVDKRFPTIERRDPIEVPQALVKEIVPEGDPHLEEERRLLYVAITRAKSGVYFTTADDYGGSTKKKLSRFMHECGFLVAPEPHSSSWVSAFAEKKAVPREQLVEKLPGHFSFTQLKAYDTCPWQYRFAHVLKVPVKGKTVFSYGQTVHLSLQRAYELAMQRAERPATTLFTATPSAPVTTPTIGELIKLEEVQKLYEEAWIDDWFVTAAKKKEYFAKGKATIATWYDGAKDTPLQTRYVEQGFSMKLGDGDTFYTVRGKIDRVDEVDGRLVLVDYKTGTPKTKLEAEDKEQLLIYQMAAAELWKKPVGQLMYYYVDDGSVLPFLGTEDEIEKYRQKMLKLIGQIRSLRFTPKPSRMCQFCDFREICDFRQS